jgi:hypothetical protein
MNIAQDPYEEPTDVNPFIDAAKKKAREVEQLEEGTGTSHNVTAQVLLEKINEEFCSQKPREQPLSTWTQREMESWHEADLAEKKMMEEVFEEEQGDVEKMEVFNIQPRESPLTSPKAVPTDVPTFFTQNESELIEQYEVMKKKGMIPPTQEKRKTRQDTRKERDPLIGGLGGAGSGGEGSGEVPPGGAGDGPPVLQRGGEVPPGGAGDGPPQGEREGEEQQGPTTGDGDAGDESYTITFKVKGKDKGQDQDKDKDMDKATGMYHELSVSVTN